MNILTRRSSTYLGKVFRPSFLPSSCWSAETCFSLAHWMMSRIQLSLATQSPLLDIPFHRKFELDRFSPCVFWRLLPPFPPAATFVLFILSFLSCCCDLSTRVRWTFEPFYLYSFLFVGVRTYLSAPSLHYYCYEEGELVLRVSYVTLRFSLHDAPSSIILGFKFHEGLVKCSLRLGRIAFTRYRGPTPYGSVSAIDPFRSRVNWRMPEFSIRRISEAESLSF